MKTLLGPRLDPIMAATLAVTVVASAFDQMHRIGIHLSQAWLLILFLTLVPYMGWRAASLIKSRQSMQVWPSLKAVLRSEGIDSAGQRCASLHIDVVTHASKVSRARDMLALLADLPSFLSGGSAKSFSKITITSALLNDRRCDQLTRSLQEHGWAVVDRGTGAMPWEGRFMLGLYKRSETAAAMVCVTISA